jgi:hypothetical protein
MIIDFYNLSAALAEELEEAKKINKLAEKALKIAKEAAEELSKCHVKKPQETQKKEILTKTSLKSI